MTDWIAERRLLYAVKGSPERRELVIRVGKPYLVQPGTVTFSVAEGTAGCSVEFAGLNEVNPGETYGADLLQALQLAADVEPILKRLCLKYDFYFPTGEPYFEEDIGG